MPLGQYGYEPEPMEEPEPEREGRKVNVLGIGCGLLGAAALVTLVAFLLQTGMLKKSGAVYSNHERVVLRDWLRKQKPNDWLVPVQSKIVSSSVAFDEGGYEVRVHRLRGISMQECITLVEKPLQRAGFSRALSDSRSNLMSPTDQGFRASYERRSDDFYVDFERDKNGEDILLRESMPAAKTPTQDELGFDPRRNTSWADINDLAPPTYRDH